MNKTPPARELARNEDGSYTGSLGQGLTDQKRKAIRQAFANSSEPLALSGVMRKAQVSEFNVAEVQSASQFLVYLESTKEIEPVKEVTKDGEVRFQGRYQSTDHGRSLVEKGLA